MSSSVLEAAPAVAAALAFEWDMFISHVQGEAGAHVLALREAIAAVCPTARPWIDLDEDATTAGMLRGIAQSRAIVIFVSSHIFARQWCQFEIKKAIEARAASQGLVRLVFVAVNGCSFVEALAAGRTFSASEENQNKGHVHLEEADFVELQQSHVERPSIVFHVDEWLLTVTVPAVLTESGFDADAVSGAGAAMPIVPFRMRRAPPIGALGCDILLVAAPNGAVQCSFLRMALRRMCARRTLVIRTLKSSATPRVARAAVAGARHVVCLLTDKMWDRVAVREAMLARSPKHKVTLLHEMDVRSCYGGVQSFGDLLDQRPAALASLFDDHMARVFERKKALRTVMVEQLLRDTGAVPSDLSGGNCPPPRLPHGYREDAVLATLVQLEAALLDAPGTLAVATGGMGGAGKTTVATALATRSARVRVAFDDVLWVPLGSQVGRVELLAAVVRVVRELEETSYDAPGSHGDDENEAVPVVLDTVEAATRRLRELLATRRVLLVVDDARKKDHFFAFLGAVSSVGGGRQIGDMSASKILFTTRELDHFECVAKAVRLVDACVTVPLALLGQDAARDFVAAGAGIPRLRAAELNLEPIFEAVGTTPLSLSIVAAVMRTKLEPLTCTDRLAEIEVTETLTAMLGRGGNDIAATGQWIDQPAFRDALASRMAASGIEAYIPLYRTIDLALRSQFGESDWLNFAALSLFPKGRPIAESLVRVAWRADRERTRTLLVALQGAGLIKFETADVNVSDDSDANDGRVMLHDLALDFASSVVAVQRDGASMWHTNLLNRLATGTDDEQGQHQSEPMLNRPWWVYGSGPSIVSQYVAECVYAHLSAASLHTELLSLASSLPWLQCVLRQRGVTELLRDFADYVMPIAHRYADAHAARGLQLLYEALRLSRHALDCCKECACNGLAGQLVGRLPDDLLSAHPLLLGKLHAACLAWNGPHAMLLPVSASLSAPGDVLQAIMEGHADSVTCMCVLPDGRVVSGSRDHTLRVWDPTTGACERELEGHTESVQHMCVLVDGRIVSGSTDNTLRVWDAATGACERVLKGHSSSVECICVLLDGRIVSGSADHTLRVWDPATGACNRELQGHTGQVECIRVLHDSLIVSGSSDRTLRVWDTATGSCKRVLTGHTDRIRCICVLADGRIVTGSEDKTLRVWDTATGACKRVLEGHSFLVGCVDELPDGRIVSGSLDDTLRVWDASTGACERVLVGHSEWPMCMCVLPDGRIVSGSRDTTLRIWDPLTGTCKLVLEGHHSSVLRVCTLPDGRIVSGSLDNSLRVWDSSFGARAREREGHSRCVKCVSAMSDGRVVSGSLDFTLRVWDPATGACQRVLEGHTQSVRCICVLPDDRIVSASMDGTLRVWDPVTGACKRVLKGHTHAVECVFLLPDGCIVSGSSDTTLRVWDPATGACKRVLKGHTDEIFCMCVLADGRIVSGSRDTTLRVWDAMTGTCERVLKGHTGWVECVCAIPDGRILSGSTRDDTLRVWDAATGVCEFSRDYLGNHNFQEPLHASAGLMRSAETVTKGSSVKLFSTGWFVCDDKVVHCYIAPSGLVFVFCESGRLHVLRRSFSASC